MRVMTGFENKKKKQRILKWQNVVDFTFHQQAPCIYSFLVVGIFNFIIYSYDADADADAKVMNNQYIYHAPSTVQWMTQFFGHVYVDVCHVFFLIIKRPFMLISNEFSTTQWLNWLFASLINC